MTISVNLPNKMILKMSFQFEVTEIYSFLSLESFILKRRHSACESETCAPRAIKHSALLFWVASAFIMASWKTVMWE
jgi:hypothetical protein